MVLDKINDANDIKKIPSEEYSILADEIRQYIIEKVGNNGGHLSSSLGVVELTMALHLALNLPEDKIIWDVGHQAYAHKILTGRKEQFDTLRKKGGLSGFPSIAESQYDSFGAGHASTSISAAMGFAEASQLEGKNNHIVTVIGDGALTGGMAYEALNNVGTLKRNFIIILNDNEMSISKNVGGISKMLTNLRTDSNYNQLKTNVKNTLSKIPGLGDGIVKRIHKTKSSIKQFFVPGMMFEDMGITYLGPVDGHDVKQMVRMIEQAEKVKHAVIIHVHTIKGKGYTFAEKKPSFYHGVAPFTPENGKLINNEKIRTYSDVFSSAIVKNAENDPKIVAITAAMSDGTGLKQFEKNFPKRFYDVGIAEEHAVTFAAGMAVEGYKPYVAIYSTFLQRSFDQILHDVCIQNLPVRLIVERAGIVGCDGVTHQGIFDLSYLGMIPNMTIMAPKNRYELKQMIDYSVNFDGPLAIRFPRGKAEEVYGNTNCAIEYGKTEILNNGSDVSIMAVGTGVKIAYDIHKMLLEKGINATVINARFVKPVDKECIDKIAKEHKLLVTIEENVSAGGFGSSVLAYVNENRLPVQVYNVALKDAFIEHGCVEELRKENGLDAELIAKEILRRMK